MMNWQEIFAVVAPLLLCMGWLYTRLERKLETISGEIREIKGSISSIESRYARMEGKLEEKEFQEWKQTRQSDTSSQVTKW